MLKKRTLQLFFLFIFIILLFFAPLQSWSNEVSINTALTGALHYAQKVFGPLVHFHTQVFVDFDDIPQTYVFLLCHPDHSVLDLLTSGKDIISNFPANSDGSGIVTAVAGANKSHVPVIQMYQGLPDYILNIEKIKSTLMLNTSKESLRVIRYLYIAPLEFWLEFQNPKSLKTYYVRASDISIMDEEYMERLKSNLKRERSLHSDQNRTERIRKKWEFVEGLCLD
jgi:hypothetical protein